MFITRTSQAEHVIDHGHEISTFQHSLEFMTMLRYTRVIHPVL